MPKTPPPPDFPAWEQSFTCDWGDCDHLTLVWRYSGQRLAESPLGWLPVCAIHAQADAAVIAHIDGGDRGSE